MRKRGRNPSSKEEKTEEKKEEKRRRKNRRAMRLEECTQHIINDLMPQLDKDSFAFISNIFATMFESPHLLGKIVSISNSLYNEIESGKIDASHVAAAFRNL